MAVALTGQSNHTGSVLRVSMIDWSEQDCRYPRGETFDRSCHDGFPQIILTVQSPLADGVVAGSHTLNACERNESSRAVSWPGPI